MTVRKLNYTGRKRIRRSDVSVELIRGDDEHAAEVRPSVSLAHYGFPDDAQLVFEAYRQTQLVRVSIGALALPDRTARIGLDSFPDVDTVLYRLKVVANDSSGKLLGEADRLQRAASNDAEERGESILPVEEADIGDLLWWLDFSDGPPVLQISRRVPDYRSLALRPDFVWLVYPAVFKEVLERALPIADAESEDREGDWADDWVALGVSLAGREPPADDDEQDQWVREACAEFCRTRRLRSRCSQVLAPNEAL
jgi:hypothetical protein